MRLHSGLALQEVDTWEPGKPHWYRGSGPCKRIKEAPKLTSDALTLFFGCHVLSSAWALAPQLSSQAE